MQRFVDLLLEYFKLKEIGDLMMYVCWSYVRLVTLDL